jgi:hypothetical protein
MELPTTYASLAPSADQAGCFPPGPTNTRPDPSGLTVYMSVAPELLPAGNAIFPFAPGNVAHALGAITSAASSAKLTPDAKRDRLERNPLITPARILAASGSFLRKRYVEDPPAAELGTRGSSNA